MKQSKETKDKILRAAITLIAKKGFHNTKTREIAKGAKITEPTLYTYYDSKDNILAAIFKKGLAELNTVVLNTMKNSQQTRDFWRKFELLLTTVVKFIEENPNLAALIIREYFIMNPRLRTKIIISLSRHKSIVDLITFFYRVYLERNSIPPDIEIRILRNLLSTVLKFILHIWGITKAQKVLELLYTTQESTK